MIHQRCLSPELMRSLHSEIMFRWAPDDAGSYGGPPMNRGRDNRGYGGQGRQDSGSQYRYEANSRWDQSASEKQDWTKPGPRNERLEQ